MLFEGHGGLCCPLPDYVSVTPEGVLTSIHGEVAKQGEGPAPGSGRIRAAPGSLGNLSAEAVRLELKHAGLYSPREDYNITEAWRAALKPDYYTEMCSGFGPIYSMRERYGDSNSHAWTILQVSTARGEAKVTAYGSSGPEELVEVVDLLKRFAAAAKEDAWKPA